MRSDHFVRPPRDFASIILKIQPTCKLQQREVALSLGGVACKQTSERAPFSVAGERATKGKESLLVVRGERERETVPHARTREIRDFSRFFEILRDSRFETRVLVAAAPRLSTVGSAPKKRRMPANESTR